MPFNGPGIYAIVPFGSPEFTLNSWGGGMNAGEDVKTYQRDRKNPSDNSLFQVALVKGSGDDAEYLLINVRNGYYVTATDERKVVSCQQRSPRDTTVRWKIVSSPAKMPDQTYDTFAVNCVEKNRGQLNVAGDKLGGGVDILSWPIENGGNTKFYFDRYD